MNLFVFVASFTAVMSSPVFDCGFFDISDCMKQLVCKTGAKNETTSCQEVDRSLALTPSKNYGCYCRDRADYEAAKRRAVDDFDKVCRDRVKRLRCIQMDIDAGFYSEPGCNNVNVEDLSFVSALEFVTIPGTNDPGIGCVETGIDQCLIDLCASEIGSMQEEVDAEFDGVFDSGRQFVNGFDPAAECSLSSVQLGTDPIGRVTFDGCCGEYPNRYPFSSTGNGNTGGTYPAKECCEISGKIF